MKNKNQQKYYEKNKKKIIKQVHDYQYKPENIEKYRKIRRDFINKDRKNHPKKYLIRHRKQQNSKRYKKWKKEYCARPEIKALYAEYHRKRTRKITIEKYNLALKKLYAGNLFLKPDNFILDTKYLGLWAKLYKLKPFKKDKLYKIIPAQIKKKNFYKITVGNKKALVHRAVMEGHLFKKIPKNIVVYYADRNTLNNNINNLKMMKLGKYIRFREKGVRKKR